MNFLLFHQNMRNFGGIARADEYVEAFKEIRTVIQDDVILAAGFTEITNDKSSKNALENCVTALQPGDDMVGYHFACGTKVNGELSEYVALYLLYQEGVDWQTLGASYIYVEDSNPQESHIFTFIDGKPVSAKANAPNYRIGQLPPFKMAGSKSTYTLATTYRCVAFAQAEIVKKNPDNKIKFVVGFLHNVAGSNGLSSSGILMNKLSDIVNQIQEKCGIDENTCIILGGDYNVSPHNVIRKHSTMDATDRILALYALKEDTTYIPENTTKVNCLDFWMASRIKRTTTKLYFNKTSCATFPQALQYIYKGTSTTLSDHKAITIKIRF